MAVDFSNLMSNMQNWANNQTWLDSNQAVDRLTSPTTSTNQGNNVLRFGQDFLGGFTKGGFKGGLGAAAGVAGDIMSNIGSKIGQRRYGDDFSEDQKRVQSTLRSVASAMGPVGQIIAAASGAVDAIGSATGLNLSNIDKNDAARAGIKGTGFNRAMNYLPGNSMIWGGLNALMGGKRTDDYNVSDMAQEMSEGYAGTLADMQAAGRLGNKRLFTRGQERSANRFINEQRENDEIIRGLNETNTMRKQSNYYQDLAHQNINRYAGQSYLGVSVGKEGLKLISAERARQILSSKKSPEKFKNGGIVGIDQSLLPGGALHKELHHLDEVDPELAEDVTRKGIPIVTVDENGEIEQVAEIERDELLLTKALTEQLEALRADGSDEAMIAAGKLLATEIITNTQDNTGQITEEVQNGE